jgi:hypothetical protein
MHGDLARFSALAMDSEMLHAPAVMKIPYCEGTQLGAARGVVEEQRQDGAIAFGFEALALRGVEHGAHLDIGDRRRLTLITLDLWPRNAFDWVVRDGVALAEAFKERGQRSALRSDRGPCKLPLDQRLAPGDDVGPGDIAKLLGPHDPGKPHELADSDPVHTTGAWTVDIREPVGFGRHVAQDAREFRAQPRNGSIYTLPEPTVARKEPSALSINWMFFERAYCGA